MAVQISVQLLAHACNCWYNDCEESGCFSTKQKITHFYECKAKNSCSLCIGLVDACLAHSNQCNENPCMAPFCLHHGKSVSQSLMVNTPSQSSLRPTPRGPPSMETTLQQGTAANPTAFLPANPAFRPTAYQQVPTQNPAAAVGLPNGVARAPLKTVQHLQHQQQAQFSSASLVDLPAKDQRVAQTSPLANPVHPVFSPTTYQQVPNPNSAAALGLPNDKSRVPRNMVPHLQHQQQAQVFPATSVALPVAKAAPLANPVHPAFRPMAYQQVPTQNPAAALGLPNGVARAPLKTVPHLQHQQQEQVYSASPASSLVALPAKEQQVAQTFPLANPVHPVFRPTAVQVPKPRLAATVGLANGVARAPLITPPHLQHQQQTQVKTESIIKWRIWILEHCANCEENLCSVRGCTQAQTLLLHTMDCKSNKNGACPTCHECLQLSKHHVMHCHATVCIFPFCSDLKQKMFK